MIGYLAKTFCISPCANVDCDRRLTEEHRSAARAWWGSESAPIITAEFLPGCTEHVAPKKEQPKC